MPIDAARILGHGWRQGSIFPLEASQPLVLARRDAILLDGFRIADNARLILASHSCDIVHVGVHEPRIEVCPSVPVGGLDGSFTGTRNARRLHIELDINGVAHAYELRAPMRFYVPREILQDCAPDPAARIAPRHHDHFCHWLAKRVRRTALPTEFDRRIDARTRSRIRAALRPLQDHVHSILIAIDPEDAELPAGEIYTVQVVGLMETRDHEDAQKRAAVDAAMARIQVLIDRCNGVDIEVCVSESMGQMTLDEFRDFAVWDYDELSLDADVEPPQDVP